MNFKNIHIVLVALLGFLPMRAQGEDLMAENDGGGSESPRITSPKSFGEPTPELRKESVVETTEKAVNLGLTGDWGGARTLMSEKGVDFTLAYTGEYLANLSGGDQSGDTYEGLFEIALDLDSEKLGFWKGGSFHVNSYEIHGSSLTQKYIHDLGVISNIDSYDSLRIQEYWFQQVCWSDKLSIRVGQMAADKEFFGSDNAALFLNGAFGTLPTISANLPNPPVYPMAGTGIRVRLEPIEQIYVQAAVYDGDVGRADFNTSGSRANLSKDEGLLSFYELGWKLNQEEKAKGLPGTYKLGAFYHSDQFTDRLRDADGAPFIFTLNDAAIHNGDYGLYVIGDQTVFREASDKEDSDQGLSLWTRVSGTPANRNLVSFYVDGGFNYKGLVPTRDEDVFGLGVSYIGISQYEIDSQISDRDLNGTTPVVLSDAETIIELTYKAVFTTRSATTPQLSVQPDLQWILHPGGSPAIRDAFVAGIRFNCIFYANNSPPTPPPKELS